MTSWILDNVGGTMLEEIADRISAAGGKIEGELHKMAKGGVVVTLDNVTAPATMCKIADWCASKKIQCHLPKTIVLGTARIVIKNLPAEFEANDIVEALREEDLEILELYMFKNSHGMIKTTVKASSKVTEWTNNKMGEIRGTWYSVEKQRIPMTCFNCNKIGHRAATCLEEKKCKNCGQGGHLKADCIDNASKMSSKCNYCFGEDHRRGECQKKKEDEREERKKYKEENKNPVFENAWTKTTTSSKPNDNENKDERENLKEEIKKEMKEEMQAIQQTMIEEMKLMQQMMKEEMRQLIQELTKPMVTEMMKEIKREMKNEMMKELIKTTTMETMKELIKTTTMETMDEVMKQKVKRKAEHTPKHTPKQPPEERARIVKALEEGFPRFNVDKDKEDGEVFEETENDPKRQQGGKTPKT